MATFDPNTAELIAKTFHANYEAIAPQFGYETRESSAVEWENVPDQNKQLMIATVMRTFETRHIPCTHAELTCPCGGSERLVLCMI